MCYTYFQSSSWEYPTPLWLNTWKNCLALLLEHGSGVFGKSKLVFHWNMFVQKVATSKYWNQPAPLLYTQKELKRTKGTRMLKAHTFKSIVAADKMKDKSSLYNTELVRYLQ